ncbi:MAG: hypothetical protein ACEQSX_20480 [Baekduiaceae bacterium]
MSEIDDRHQRAREAYFDTAHDLEDRTMGRDLQAAIEAATRVQITPEIQEAITLVEDAFGREQYRAAIARIFEVAGFEVEE